MATIKGYTMTLAVLVLVGSSISAFLAARATSRQRSLTITASQVVEGLALTAFDKLAAEQEIATYKFKPGTLVFPERVLRRIDNGPLTVDSLRSEVRRSRSFLLADTAAYAASRRLTIWMLRNSVSRIIGATHGSYGSDYVLDPRVRDLQRRISSLSPPTGSSFARMTRGIVDSMYARSLVLGAIYRDLSLLGRSVWARTQSDLLREEATISRNRLVAAVLGALAIMLVSLVGLLDHIRAKHPRHVRFLHLVGMTLIGIGAFSVPIATYFDGLALRERTAQSILSRGVDMTLLFIRLEDTHTDSYIATEPSGRESISRASFENHIDWLDYLQLLSSGAILELGVDPVRGTGLQMPFVPEDVDHALLAMARDLVLATFPGKNVPRVDNATISWEEKLKQMKNRRKVAGDTMEKVKRSLGLYYVRAENSARAWTLGFILANVLGTICILFSKVSAETARKRSGRSGKVPTPISS